MKRSDHGFLRDVFCIFAVPKHTECDAERQRSGLGKMRLARSGVRHINRRLDATPNRRVPGIMIAAAKSTAVSQECHRLTIEEIVNE